jgi:diadenosine tetraphosphate (Ap4A) HIT family hydrolase
VTAADEMALGRLFTVAAQIAQQEGIAENGYRLLVNCNRDGGQEVYHLHMHLLGGRRLGVDVAKRRDEFILIDNVRWNFPPDNFAEDGFLGHSAPSCWLVGLVVEPIETTEPTK